MPKLFVPLLVLIVTLGQIAVDLYLPSLPAIANHFHASESLTETTLTVYLFGFGFSQLIYGPLSDYYGRKKILLFGMSLFILASLGCALSQTIHSLIVMRLIQGFGAGAGAVLTRAIIRDAFDGTHISKIVSYISLAWSLVPIIAPILGGYIQHYSSWQISFLSIFLYGTVIVFLVIKILPNTNQSFLHSELNFQKIIKNYIAIIFNKSFLSAALCSALSYTILIAYVAASPFLIQTNLGFSPVLYGWTALITASAYLLGNYTNSYFVTRLGMHKVIQIGILFLGIGSFLLLTFALFDFFNIWTLILPIYIILMGVGFIFPNCTAEALIPFRHIAGTAGAALGFLQMLSCSLANTFITKFSHITQLPLALLFIVITAMLGYILISVRQTESIKKVIADSVN